MYHCLCYRGFGCFVSVSFGKQSSCPDVFPYYFWSNHFVYCLICDVLSWGGGGFARVDYSPLFSCFGGLLIVRSRPLRVCFIPSVTILAGLTAAPLLSSKKNDHGDISSDRGKAYTEYIVATNIHVIIGRTPA